MFGVVLYDLSLSNGIEDFVKCDTFLDHLSLGMLRNTHGVRAHLGLNPFEHRLLR